MQFKGTIFYGNIKKNSTSYAQILERVIPLDMGGTGRCCYLLKSITYLSKKCEALIMIFVKKTVKDAKKHQNAKLLHVSSQQQPGETTA